jgi:G6PDH family F420-dependent oxidoreductase
MASFGYFLSSEELGPKDEVRWAQRAEEAGFDRVWISDHYHPWNDAQGQSPFVWAVIGGIAATTGLHVTTAVTCPTIRTHPAVIAQAAATCSLLLDGRFALGVGSGEFLNEHILGDHWPPTDLRLEMLGEAIQVMRALWTGDWVTHYGEHYVVEDARIYSCPPEPVPVYISGFGPKSIALAAEIGDGYVNTAPEGEMIQQYRDKGGKGPTQAGVKVCWAEDEQAAVKTAHRLWANSGVPGEASQELRMPQHFEQVSQLVTEDMTKESVACGPDPERHMAAITPYLEAGYDEVFVSQMGEEQEGFFRFWETELQPRLAKLG